jgi:8-oxo-dGTP diphosphatase
MRYSGKTATAIITYPENKILLIKRSTPPFVGYWALPGGRSEPEETAQQTIIREVKEETGLDITVTSKIGEYHEQGVQAGLEYDYYATCFLTKPIAGAIKGQESEISDIQLFSLDGLPKALAFEHTQMIKDYVLRIRQKYK